VSLPDHVPATLCENKGSIEIEFMGNCSRLGSTGSRVLANYCKCGWERSSLSALLSCRMPRNACARPPAPSMGRLDRLWSRRTR
jgi:hypothetical protein